MWNFIVIFVFKCSVSVPGVEIVLYIKDHNGNKFYSKLYCVILDELSEYTTLFFCQIKRKKESFARKAHPSLAFQVKTKFNCICDEYQTHFSHISLRSDQLFCSRRCERVLIWQGWFMARHLLSGHKHEPHVSRAQPPSLCTHSFHTYRGHRVAVVNRCV